MNFHNEIEITQPIEKVISLLVNPSNFPKWMPGFISMDPISGITGEEGSTARFKFKSAGRIIELTETIIKRKLPEEIHFTYTGKGVLNFQQNYFTETSQDCTKWTMASEYRFTGFIKHFDWIMRGFAKRSTQKILTRFKTFAEKENS